MTANLPQSAHGPDLSRTRASLRPLTSRETMLRAKAIAANKQPANALKCSGQIYIGLFFDGTGNNEEADFKSVRSDPANQKQSNVVRLYHAYPVDVARATDRYFSFYVPGVGTPFPEISDSGGAFGTAMSWNGEARLIWGITRIFTAVSRYVSGENLIDDQRWGKIAQNVGGIGSSALHRKMVFKNSWIPRLKEVLAQRTPDYPDPEQINLSVFGFSRGAAEARAFVNWLYGLCEEADGDRLFAGIRLRVDFLGIFDTVASVGVAGAFSNGPIGFEGRQSWADDNMQVHPAVESCLHIVAAHEVRSTFPLDSVRLDDKYPQNVKEYVYPGAHSDVGGGYHPKAQGKTDAIARIPGFEMYCAALAAGVPFLGMGQMSGRAARALVPSQVAVDAFTAYCKQAAVKPGPVEQMMRDHMAHYFNYRYHGRPGEPASAVTPYYNRDFFKRAAIEQKYLRNTQRYFIAILAAVASVLNAYMETRSSFDDYVGQPFQTVIPGMGGALAIPVLLVGGRMGAIHDSYDTDERYRLAHQVHEKVKAWRQWLEDHNSPFLVDEGAPERDILSVVAALSETPPHADVARFFDEWVHDSAAGMAKDGLDEFMLNGIGMAKYRRVYFGDRGDAVLREAAARQNSERKKVAEARRAQRKQWDLESREFQRTRW